MAVVGAVIISTASFFPASIVRLLRYYVLEGRAYALHNPVSRSDRASGAQTVVLPFRSEPARSIAAKAIHCAPWVLHSSTKATKGAQLLEQAKVQVVESDGALPMIGE